DEWTPAIGNNTSARKLMMKENKLYFSGSITRDNPFGEYSMAAISLIDGSWQGGLLREPVPGQYYFGNDFILLNNSIYLAGGHIRSSSPFLQNAVVKLNEQFELDAGFSGLTPMNSTGGVSLTEING